MINTQYFTEFSRALDSGYFKGVHPDSLEWRDIWQEQVNRCVNGYTVGGRYMSGPLYFYVNFCTIDRFDYKKREEIKGKPVLRDVEWLLYDMMEEAYEQEKGIMIMTRRRLGKSFSLSGRAVWEFVFNPNAGVIVGAFDSEKSTDFMKKCRQHLENLPRELYIPLLKDVIDDKFMSGWKEKDEVGNWVLHANNRVIENVVFQNRHTAANGKRANFFVFEEVGMFNNLLKCYNSAKPCWRQGGFMRGLPVLIGTGGDMQAGTIDAREIWENPLAYNLLPCDFEEKWKNIGLFIPAWMGNDMFIDDEGNSLKEPAMEYFKTERKNAETAGNLEALYLEMQYNPFTPDEVFLRSGSNRFPSAAIQAQIERIMQDVGLQNIAQRGFMAWEGGKVVFEATPYAKEVSYPHKKDDFNDGCIVIYEEPELIAGQIPYGLYIAGTDPYAQDKAESSVSLGSTFVYKRFSNASRTGDIIVAEYTGRPKTSDEYNEQLRMLLMYYNAKVLYENNIPGMKQWFETKRSLHLLCPSPEHIKDLVEGSIIDRAYGFATTVKSKFYLIQAIRDWLLTEFDIGRFNVEKIYCVNLLREMMAYNDKENFDRIISFGLCLIQDREMFNVKVKEEKADTDDWFAPIDKLYRDNRRDLQEQRKGFLSKW